MASFPQLHKGNYIYKHLTMEKKKYSQFLNPTYVIP